MSNQTHRMLHQIVAVWRGRQKRADNIIREAIQTFVKRKSLFEGHHAHYNPIEDPVGGVSEFLDDTKSMDETVYGKLDYVWKTIVEYVDILSSLESTNQTATATIYFNGAVVKENVPVTMLMNLEKMLVQWREMLSHVPTLPPGTEWVPDPNHALDHVYRAKYNKESVKFRQDYTARVLWEPKEPQYKQDPIVEKIELREPKGTMVTIQWNSMISPSDKSELLDNLDKLLEAVQDAFQRAKTTPVIDAPLGKQLVSCIMTGNVLLQE